MLGGMVVLPAYFTKNSKNLAVSKTLKEENQKLFEPTPKIKQKLSKKFFEKTETK